MMAAAAVIVVPTLVASPVRAPTPFDVMLLTRPRKPARAAELVPPVAAGGGDAPGDVAAAGLGSGLETDRADCTDPTKLFTAAAVAGTAAESERVRPVADSRRRPRAHTRPAGSSLAVAGGLPPTSLRLEIETSAHASGAAMLTGLVAV